MYEETSAKGLRDKLQNLFKGNTFTKQDLFMAKMLYNLIIMESSLQVHLNEFSIIIVD